MNFLWIDFVNSDCHDHLGRGPDTDRLDDAAWTRDFLKRFGLPCADLHRPVSRQALKELRSLMQQIVATCRADRPLSDAQLTAINGYLGSPAVQPRLVRQDPAYKLDLAAVGGGTAAVQFAIAASLAEFLVEGNQDRLKLCENPACRWLFYDSTRSRTRRWCASNCGSLIKVRQFRQRQSKHSRGKRKGKTAARKKSTPR